MVLIEKSIDDIITYTEKIDKAHHSVHSMLGKLAGH